MTTIFVGGDASKGYADFCLLNSSGTVLVSSRYDDSPEGHLKLSKVLEAMVAKDGATHFAVGLESTGGLERNWLHMFRGLSATMSVKVYQLNPLAVRKFLEHRLHRAVTDREAAKGIASYLSSNLNRLNQYDSSFSEDVSLYRFIAHQTQHLAAMKTQLQGALVTAHPALVQYARAGFTRWLLQLLMRYPTSAQLAKAPPAELLKLPHVKKDRVLGIIDDARRSVGSTNDTGTRLLVSNLAEEILRLEGKVKSWRDELCSRYATNRDVQILDSLPGMGAWSATTFMLEVRNFSRFVTPNALVAYVGLDPRPEVSGDGVKKRGISRRGSSTLRATLYMAILTAIRSDGAFKDFYARLRDQGKSHKVAATACMAKLVRVAYACVISDNLYEPARHVLTPPGGTPSTKDGGSLDTQAPVTRREAKRRKASLPHRGQSLTSGGQKGAPSTDATTHSSEQQARGCSILQTG